MPGAKIVRLDVRWTDYQAAGAVSIDVPFTTGNPAELDKICGFYVSNIHSVFIFFAFSDTGFYFTTPPQGTSQGIALSNDLIVRIGCDGPDLSGTARYYFTNVPLPGFIFQPN